MLEILSTVSFPFGLSNCNVVPEAPKREQFLKPLCSICITHFNDGSTIRQSLNSIVNQVDANYEIVVVDQRSTDGSRQILQEYADKGLVRVFDMQTRNRGLGRQIAFEKAEGDYVIASVNLDDCYEPIFAQILQSYRRLFQGKVAIFGSLEVASREVLQKIGGWRSLQWGEDIEHWARAAKIDAFVRVPDVKVTNTTRPFGRGRNRWQILKYRYEMMRDLRRVGRHRWDKVVDSPTMIGKASMLFLMMAGTVGAYLESQYRDPWNNSFKISDYTYSGNPLAGGEATTLRAVG